MNKLIRLYSIINKVLLIFLHQVLPKKGAFFKYLRGKIENFLFFSPRSKNIYPIQTELLGKFEPVRLMTKDCVKLHSWFIKPKEGMPIVIFCHGQSENISKWQETAIFLEKSGYGVFLLSYRGHYKSAGKPSEEGIYTDADTAINFLVEHGYSTKNIIIWGRSLGSSIPCEMALKHNLKGIILESAISNIKSAAISLSNWYMNNMHLNFLRGIIEKSFEKIRFTQNFSNDKKINKINCPILIMHSHNDSKINSEAAHELYNSNPKARLFISKEGCHDENEWCFNKVDDFLKELSY